MSQTRYIRSEDEIALTDIGEALATAELLIKNNYVVMLSKEEDLYILNYLWADNADRNYVVFLLREDIDNSRGERK